MKYGMLLRYNDISMRHANGADESNMQIEKGRNGCAASGAQGGAPVGGSFWRGATRMLMTCKRGRHGAVRICLNWIHSFFLSFIHRFIYIVYSYIDTFIMRLHIGVYPFKLSCSS